MKAGNGSHETQVIPLLLLQARLRRQDLLRKAKERAKHPPQPFVTFLWSRFKDRVIRMESRA